MEALNLSRQPTGGLVVVPASGGWLQCWERPRVGCRYLLSVRGGGAAKIVGGRRDRERSVLMVLRRSYLEEGAEDWHPARLAARLTPPVLLDPTPLAELVAMAAQWYGDALCFVEVKDGAMLAKECQRLGAAVQIQERLDRATSEWKQDLGWLTDAETGPAALNALVNAIRETGERAAADGETRRRGDEAERWPNALQLECRHALAELQTFAPGEGEAPAIAHDDDVRTLATGLFNLESASLLHAEKRQRQAPEDGWKEGLKWMNG